MNIIRFSVLAFFVLLLHVRVSAQGCSDAGFCTIGNLAAHPSDTAFNKGSKLSITLPVGVGDDDVFVFTPALEYSNNFSKHWTVQGKATMNYASGNLGNATGLGDVFLSGTYLFKPSAKWKMSATLGVKLPLNQSTLKADQLSLPLQYQSSLGTIDLITGLAVASNHWQFAAGLQQPLSGINRNNFLPVYWNKPSAILYAPSNDFDRRGDVLLRSAYSFSGNKKWTFTGGLLGIYHLGKDTYIDANVSAKPIPINGSDGLTLNVTGLVHYNANSRCTIGLSAGTPLIVRDVRADGLTRKFVISPEIIFNF